MRRILTTAYEGLMVIVGVVVFGLGAFKTLEYVAALEESQIVAAVREQHACPCCDR